MPPAQHDPAIDLSLLSQADKSNEHLKETVKKFVSAKYEHLQSFTASPAMRLSTSAPGALAGFVSCLSEHTPLNGSNGESIFTSKTGTGISWFPVAEEALPDEGAVKGVVSQFRSRTHETADAGNAVALSFAKTGAVVGLFGFDDQFERKHMVIVRGNDRAYAKKLQRRVASAAAAGAPFTLGRVVTGEDGGDAYRTLMQRSRDARVQIANAWAQAHGISLANGGQPGGSQDSHFIAHSPSRSVDVPGANARTNRAFLVYNDAFDPSTAHNGLFVWRGPVAGFWRFQGKEHVTGEGAQSHAWVNERATRPSFFPTSSGMWLGTHTGRAASLHAKANQRVAQEAGKRIAWDGPVRGYNPAANAVYCDYDGETHRWMRELSAAPGGSVSREDWRMVVLALPGLDTRKQSLSALVNVAENSGEPVLPVHATSPVIHALVDAWPHLRATDRVRAAFAEGGDASPSLAELLREELPGQGAIAVKSEVLRALHEAVSAAKEKQTASAKEHGKSKSKQQTESLSASASEE